MPLLVMPVESADEKAIALRLRFQVFPGELGYDPAVENDELDDKDTTIHFLGKDGEQGDFVAVARCLVDPENRSARIGRVAVLPESRGKQYGSALMNGIEAHVSSQVDVLGLSARTCRKSFYEKLGYACPSAETYVERGEEHCWMTKKIRC